MSYLENQMATLQNSIEQLKKLIAEKLHGHKEILSYDEAMAILNVSRNTLDRLRDEGTIKVYKLRGRQFVKYSELLQALEDNALPVT